MFSCAPLANQVKFLTPLASSHGRTADWRPQFVYLVMDKTEDARAIRTWGCPTVWRTTNISSVRSTFDWAEGEEAALETLRTLQDVYNPYAFYCEPVLYAAKISSVAPWSTYCLYLDFWIMAGMNAVEKARARVAARRERENAQRASRAIPANLGDGARDLTESVDPTVGFVSAGEVVVPPCPEKHEGEAPVVPLQINIVDIEGEESEAEGESLDLKKRKGRTSAYEVMDVEETLAAAGAGAEGVGTSRTGPKAKKQKKAPVKNQGFDLFLEGGDGSHYLNTWESFSAELLQGGDKKHLDEMSWSHVEKLEHQLRTQLLAVRAHREKQARQDRTNLVNLRREAQRKGPQLQKDLEEAQKELAEANKKVDALAFKCQTSDSKFMSLEVEVAELTKTQEQAMGALSRAEGENARLKGVCGALLEGEKGARSSVEARAVARVLRSEEFKESVATRELEGQEKGHQLAVAQITHLGAFAEKFDPAVLDVLKTVTLEEPAAVERGDVAEDVPGEFALVF